MLHPLFPGPTLVLALWLWPSAAPEPPLVPILPPGCEAALDGELVEPRWSTTYRGGLADDPYVGNNDYCAWKGGDLIAQRGSSKTIYGSWACANHRSPLTSHMPAQVKRTDPSYKPLDLTREAAAVIHHAEPGWFLGARDVGAEVVVHVSREAVYGIRPYFTVLVIPTTKPVRIERCGSAG